uniref:Uncharacterized protein n=1 Tax=Tanacetum cinerariifolium TaxID=118510 RepID=A0A699JHH3_TANCI|nr:hypothetical protein [Tanacetum cinerariifolium]
MASQDARLSKFKADSKQQQSEITNKIDTFLKAINDRITRALPSDTIKNPKLNVNSTTPVLSARSYPTDDPQYPSQIHKSKEHEQTLKEEIKDLHLKLPVLEVLAYPPTYNAILDKYVESLKLGRGFLTTASVVIDCRKEKIAVGKGITRSVFRIKEIDLGGEEVPYRTTLGRRESYGPRLSTNGIGAQTPFNAKTDFLNHHLLREWECARDAELNPFTDILVFRKVVEFFGSTPINLKGNM